jgi:hypothetical protein
MLQITHHAATLAALCSEIAAVFGSATTTPTTVGGGGLVPPAFAGRAFRVSRNQLAYKSLTMLSNASSKTISSRSRMLLGVLPIAALTGAAQAHCYLDIGVSSGRLKAVRG